MQVSQLANDSSLPILEALRWHEVFRACDYAKPQIKQERNGICTTQHCRLTNTDTAPRKQNITHAISSLS
jgi:hypothetical protein